MVQFPDVLSVYLTISYCHHVNLLLTKYLKLLQTFILLQVQFHSLIYLFWHSSNVAWRAHFIRSFFLSRDIDLEFKSWKRRNKNSEEEHFASSAGFTSFFLSILMPSLFVSRVGVSILFCMKRRSKNCGEWGNKANWFLCSLRVYLLAIMQVNVPSRYLNQFKQEALWK